MQAVVNVLAFVNTRVANAGRATAGAILGVMLLVIMAQVVSRYVFNNSLSWTEELSKSLMVWTTFLVAPWALRSGANVAIDLFQEAMPRRARFLVELTITGLILWILVVLLAESMGFVERGMRSRMATLPIATGLVYAVIPASLGAMILAAAEIFLRQLRELITGVPDPTAPQRSHNQLTE
jgi:TRAP-type C4-dicarboxylate transport system permease small subunit